MSRRTEFLSLICILALALALRLYDLRGVPPGAQHDEVFSANFATQILAGARPVYWDQNGGVPPLHAYLIAPVFAAFGTNILTLRLVSVACSMLTILFTYLTARRLFGVGVALISGALLSVTQWHLFESRVGLEPITLMMMASATAFFVALSKVQSPKSPTTLSTLDAVRPAPDGVGHWTLDLLTGVLLGLTLYTYQSSPLVFIALVLFAAYLLIWHRAQFKLRWRSFALMLATALIIVTPLAVHFLTTTGDATSRPEDLASDLRAALDGDFEALSNDVGGVLSMAAFSGDPSWRYNLPGRPVFGIVVGLLAYLGFALSLRRWREPRCAFVVIWIACNVLASAATRASPSFLRSSAALPFIVMLPAIAICDLRFAILRLRSGQVCDFTFHASRITHRAVDIASLALIVLLIVLEAAGATHDYFTAWANAARVRSIYRADLAEIANFLDAQKPAGTVMLSARFPADLDQDALYLLQQRKQRYQWFNGRRALVFPNDRSGQGVNYFIPATNESLGDGAALLQTLEARTGLLDEKGKPFFTLYYLPGDELQRLRARAPQIPLRANAANEMELMGADVNLANRSAHVLLTWRVTQRVRGDFNRTIFTHLLDANGKQWTQEDRPTHPTSSWQDDDIVWQWFDLTLPPDAPAGAYWLDLGIYDANAPGQPRLNILDAHGNVVDNRVRVGPFQIQ